MKVESNDVISVLALFDISDIPYIKSPYLKILGENSEKINENNFEKRVKVKEKKIGDNNDGNK